MLRTGPGRSLRIVTTPLDVGANVERVYSEQVVEAVGWRSGPAYGCATPPHTFRALRTRTPLQHARKSFVRVGGRTRVRIGARCFSFFGPKGRSGLQLCLEGFKGGPWCPNRHVVPFLILGRLRNSAVDTLVEYGRPAWMASRKNYFPKTMQGKS